MDEQTTTSAPSDDTGADLLAEPVKTEAPEAASQPEPKEEQAKADEPADPAQSDDKSAWLKAKGIDPSDPDALDKVAEMYRNAEKAMHQSTAKASELEKQLTSELSADTEAANPDDITRLSAEIQGLKLANSVNSFFQANPDAKALEGKMTEIVNDRPEIGQLVKAGYLSVGDLYTLARGGDVNLIKEAKQDGGREALQAVADKQQAKAVPGVATSSELNPKGEDPFLAGFEQSS